MNRPSYNPKGVCKNPIPVRLMEGEQSEVDGLAESARVSRSKVLRDCIVAGLPIVRDALLSLPSSAQSTPATAEVFTSGDATPSAAGLSTSPA